MVIKRFEDLIAWQKSQDWAILIYKKFQDCKDYKFKSQICSAVVSISNNTAEGFDRSSDADFSRFLYMAISSCSEVKSMAYLALRLEYIDESSKEEIILASEEVAKILRGLIKSLHKVASL